jgi:putative hydrolase of HD superfamily
MASAHSAGAADLIFELGTLKRAKRTGWWIAGVKDPESIAEHSFRTVIIGTMLAAMEGADPARVALLCALHDTQETRVGDIPHVGRR